MDYQVSRAAVAKLVAYAFPAVNETLAVQAEVTTPPPAQRDARWLAAYVNAVVNVAVTRQWAVEV